jgi:hypothetical protein
MTALVLSDALGVTVAQRRCSLSLALLAVLLVLVFYPPGLFAKSLTFKLVPVAFNMLQSEWRSVNNS